MADAVSRREARRQKILQNSESRFNRLLGKAEVSVSGHEHTARGPEESSSVDDLSYEPTYSLEESATTPKNVSNSASPKSAPTSIRQRAKPDTGTLHGSAQQPPLISNVSITNSNVGSESQKETVVHTDPLRILDLMRCGGCVLTAFLTRWSLTFGLGLLFFEWVLLPFLILEGSLYYFQTTHMKDIQLPHKSSMIGGALILSGVKPDIISSYNQIMGYITAVSEDFALYLFSFLVFHAFMG
ncbi:hypothetical protein BaRGS_00024098 [Batillaria attramentaria]|uniref:Calcium signal-modulating cyclophilin ligand n=1 Tax=Batillaria attramentaria TaxID=370345 RepID=A0ABD0KC49_9CAEN